LCLMLVHKSCNYSSNWGSPPLGVSGLRRFWLSWLDPFVFLFTETFKLFGFQIFWPWAYSRNASCKLNLISTFLLHVSLDCLFVNAMFHVVHIFSFLWCVNFCHCAVLYLMLPVSLCCPFLNAFRYSLTFAYHIYLVQLCSTPND
jgi:hypothetical protein